MISIRPFHYFTDLLILHSAITQSSYSEDIQIKFDVSVSTPTAIPNSKHSELWVVIVVDISHLSNIDLLVCTGQELLFSRGYWEPSWWCLWFHQYLKGLGVWKWQLHWQLMCFSGFLLLILNSIDSSRNPNFVGEPDLLRPWLYRAGQCLHWVEWVSKIRAFGEEWLLCFFFFFWRMWDDRVKSTELVRHGESKACSFIWSLCSVHMFYVSFNRFFPFELVNSWCSFNGNIWGHSLINFSITRGRNREGQIYFCGDGPCTMMVAPSISGPCPSTAHSSKMCCGPVECLTTLNLGGLVKLMANSNLIWINL